MARTERVSLMIQNFYSEFDDGGKSVAEIAKKYGVSASTIYKNMAVIAEKSGVSVDDLYRNAKGGKKIGTINTAKRRKKNVSINDAKKALDEVDKKLILVEGYFEARLEDMKNYLELYEENKWRI